MSALEHFRQVVAESLEEIREFIHEDQRDAFKLTFCARHPENPELDLVVTEDDRDGLVAMIDRRVK